MRIKKIICLALCLVMMGFALVGCEDLDIGHYERFLDESFDKHCDYTSGKIYSAVFKKEYGNSTYEQNIKNN